MRVLISLLPVGIAGVWGHAVGAVPSLTTSSAHSHAYQPVDHLTEMLWYMPHVRLIQPRVSGCPLSRKHDREYFTEESTPWGCRLCHGEGAGQHMEV
jgi:hypothetical protein